MTAELFHSFAEVIRRGAVDIVRTVSDFTGGITEMKKVASLSEAFNLKWGPHSDGGSFCQMANLHVILSVRNCDFSELPMDENGCEGSLDVGVKEGLKIDRQGHVHAPTKAGLGLEVDWEQVEKGTELTL